MHSSALSSLRADEATRTSKLVIWYDITKSTLDIAVLRGSINRLQTTN